MGVLAFLGSLLIGKEDSSIEDLIKRVEPENLRIEIKIVYERIRDVRKAKNALPFGKSFKNQLEKFENANPREYAKLFTKLFPKIINLSNDLKILIAKIGKSKNVKIYLPGEVFEFLNLARIEFEQDKSVIDKTIILEKAA